MTALLADLRKLAGLLEPDGAWCQGASARSLSGSACDAHSDQAVCWCFVGAMHRLGIKGEERQYAIADALLPGKGLLGLITWGDAPDRTQDDVRQLIAAAIERAGGAG